MTASGNRKKRRIDGDVYEVILELARGPSRMIAPQIRGELVRMQEAEDIHPKSRIPDVRTIRSIISEDVPTDDSSPWLFANTNADVDDPANAKYILDVLSLLAERFGLHVFSHVTWFQAKWIVQLKTAYPKMRDHEVWRLTLWYTRDDLSTDERELLDAWVASRAWESAERNRHFYDVIGTPVNTRIPMLIFETDTEIPKSMSWARWKAQQKRERKQKGRDDGKA
jgi:hypothetical protein